MEFLQLVGLSSRLIYCPSKRVEHLVLITFVPTVDLDLDFDLGLDLDLDLDLDLYLNQLWDLGP